MSARVIAKSAPARVEDAMGWTSWIEQPLDDGDPLAAALDRPGLWRAVCRDGAVERVFELPPRATLARTRDCDEDEQLREALEVELWDWAMVSARGEVPPGWHAPDPERLAGWFSPRRLMVGAGPHLARGALECDAKRLRVHFPELVRLGVDLPPARERWAHALCLDLQTRWRLVRFAVADARVRAEVDLSGVPDAVAEPLFRVAVEALVFAVRWSLPAFALLADASAVSDALDCGPWWSRGVVDPHAPALPRPKDAD